MINIPDSVGAKMVRKDQAEEDDKMDIGGGNQRIEDDVVAEVNAKGDGDENKENLQGNLLLYRKF